MPVIGRLDGQVDELIIKPVGRRRAPEEADAPEDARQEDTHETPRAEPDEGRRADDDLPVWLL